MDINANTLSSLFTGINVAFNKGKASPKTYLDLVAMRTVSSTSQETYAWLDDLPGIREWLGDRVLHTLSRSRYTVVNRKFEETITIPREKIEDDTYGIFSPLAARLGEQTALFPDQLVFELLSDGTSERCYDGQYFFDTDHKAYNESKEEISVSNFTAGDGDAWYLLDCGQVLKPMLFQERTSFDLQSLTAPNDPYVFMKDEYVYGVRGRCNAGFGLWQLAHCSRSTLNKANYISARLSMMNLRKMDGKRMGITPTHLIVPPNLEDPARALLNAELVNGGETNTWARSAELIVSHHI
ncbi:Mu-like prophage major head subunit gpT [Rhizobium sp. RU35A]|uniref:Mu-like prophage major head subunit gpT family protein n=1 Tax=Rhizobium sp. RU35A TaxID=1907414 RepID=UPI00095614ED|nr:Mu-like prophage major head subunit gpT family protein [Rhizobium sp. RU35A]SIQ23449.1 Mu-like prophage major head subunit gpT [Rhizobium sp. RU35A]